MASRHPSDPQRGYYDARHARAYDRVWRRFTERTLATTMAQVDVAALAASARQQGRPPRALDVACGTGALLRTLLTWVPELRAVGVDASPAMLEQAQATLSAVVAAPRPLAQLLRGKVSAAPLANLPLAPGAFDLITCTNALHYLADPTGALAGLGELLAPGGQLVVEDFARRGGGFPWALFEWGIRRVDRQHVRAYTLAEAQTLATNARLRVADGRAFTIDWLWHGWALRLARA